MEHSTVIEATKAVVTLDVALPGIIWGWMITLNMWAKSIGTGVILVGAFLLYRHKRESLSGIRWKMPLISFIFLNIFLAFTLLDLTFKPTLGNWVNLFIFLTIQNWDKGWPIYPGWGAIGIGHSPYFTRVLKFHQFIGHLN